MKGSYILVLELAGKQRLTVGKLGTFSLAAGYYLYFGSARNGLESRVRRHLRPDKKLHWHIDSLTGVATPRQVWWSVGAERRECPWALQAGEGSGISGIYVPIPKFGSSDCNCASHLFYAPRGEAVAELRQQLSGLSSLGVYRPQPADNGFEPYDLSGS